MQVKDRIPIFNGKEVKYLSPVGSMIKFWVTTFWFLWNIKHHNHATFMNQKVVTQNFIIEQIGDKYFNLGILFSNSIWTLEKIRTKLNKNYPSKCTGN